MLHQFVICEYKIVFEIMNENNRFTYWQFSNKLWQQKIFTHYFQSFAPLLVIKQVFILSLQNEVMDVV